MRIKDVLLVGNLRMMQEVRPTADQTWHFVALTCPLPLYASRRAVSPPQNQTFAGVGEIQVYTNARATRTHQHNVFQIVSQDVRTA